MSASTSPESPQESAPAPTEQFVPQELTPVPEGSILVGHDGSADAQRALVQAIDLADKLEAPLVIVRMWTVHTAPAGTLVENGFVSSFAEVSGRVRNLLIEETKALAHRHPSVTIDYRALHGQAAETLVALSPPARMLVVGSRGRGGFPKLLLGSVSEQCVRHASCPVLVVRPIRSR
ncbi:MAG: universal stress protein [Cryobacterium sp.]